MIAFSTFSLKKKLVAAFVAIASITCIVAAIAWWNLGVLRGKLSDVANNHLPGVRSLGEVRLSLETYKLARRATKDPNLDLKDYRAMLDRIAKTQESNENAFRIFAARHMTPEETVMWNDFQAMWADWRKANDEYFHVAAGFANVFDRVASPQVPNPGRLLDHTLEANSLVRSVEVDISSHIKAWKNLLLRGEKPQEYSKYVAEMDACSRRRPCERRCPESDCPQDRAGAEVHHGCRNALCDDGGQVLGRAARTQNSKCRKLEKAR